MAVGSIYENSNHRQYAFVFKNAINVLQYKTMCFLRYILVEKCDPKLHLSTLSVVLMEILIAIQYFSALLYTLQ